LLRKNYYYNQRIRTATPYKRGVKQGVEIHFHNSGKISAEISYKDGEKDGDEKLYPDRNFLSKIYNSL
jgi:antitoxin component YwqK of YwqJK toxin-antitoxin module